MTATIEDYLKAILRISADQGSSRTSALAREVVVTPASASTMVGRLQSAGLAESVGWGRVRLTGHGAAHARSVLRRHRLAEALLHDVLGMPIEEVHAAAEVLEHALSPRLESLIDERLGHPEWDPHGSPIPAPGECRPENVEIGEER